MPLGDLHRFSLSIGVASAAGLAVLAESVALGQDRPQGAGRIVRTFDFEEQNTNPGEVPRYWHRAQEDKRIGRVRAGFPPWNEAALVYRSEGGESFSGSGAVKVPTDGGSTSLTLDSGVLPIFTEVDYRISVRARTKGLEHAGAQLIARFLDREGNSIATSEVKSRVIRSDQWNELVIELVGDQPKAADIQIELCLIQPAQRDDAGDASKVYGQDVSGEAWFDDVVITQLPKIELTADSPLNITSGKDAPQLKGKVRDLTGEPIEMAFSLFDVRGDRIATHQVGPATGNVEYAWRPPIAAFGWYRATMQVISANGTIGETFVDFVNVPEDSELVRRAKNSPDPAISSRHPRERAAFGVILETPHPAFASSVSDAVEAMKCGRVTLPLWNSNGDAIALESIMPLVDRLLDSRREVVFALERVPDSIVKSTGIAADDPLTILNGEKRIWMNHLGPYLDRYGQRVRRWQIGSVGDDRAFWRSNFGADLDNLERTLSGFVSGPRIAVPTRIDREWSPESLRTAGDPATLLTLVPNDVAEESVAHMMRAFAASLSPEADSPEFHAVLPGFPEETYAPGVGASETVKRAIECLAAGALSEPVIEPMVSIEQPWSVTKGTRPKALPRPELAAWSNLVAQMSDRRIVGTFPIQPGVVCYILAPKQANSARTGALVAWNRAASPDEAILEADPGGDSLNLIDLYGNAKPIEPAAQAGASRIRVPLTDEPVFIDGIDVELCRFISAFAIDPTFIESSDSEREHTLNFRNPWPVAITGTVSILEPGGVDPQTGQRDRSWRISPRTMPISIAPGESHAETIAMAFNPTEEQGPRPFIVSVNLNADRQYENIKIRRTIEVGLNFATVDLAYRFQGAASEDVIIEAVVGNTGGSPLTLELTCFAPGSPRTKSTVTDLTPGRQVVKRFTFSGKAADMRGKRVIVTGSAPGGGARVTKSVVIE